MVGARLSCSSRLPQTCLMVSMGMMLAPMAWVMPPASLAAMAVPLTESRRRVFPWSTWPMTATIGCLIIGVSALGGVKKGLHLIL